jgi:putative ABC transport system permease protein
MIKIWFRTLIRYKLYTFINVAGLSLGICAVVAIFVYVSDELSYDRFHANADRIYRINVTNKFDTESHWPTTSAPIAEAIRNDLTTTEKVARIYSREASIEVVSKTGGSTRFREENAWFADPEILETLTLDFIAGDPKTALSQVNKLVIARSVADRYFGSPEKALGADVLFEGSIPMTISGVYDDFPSQSYFEATAIAHFENYYDLEAENIQQYLREDWIYNPLQTFVLLKPGVDPIDFEDQLLTLRDKYGDERVRKSSTYQLQKLTDIYLRSSFDSGDQPRMQNIYVLASIGFVILIIACVNFINLANVHSLKRAREIGIRKVLGAQKRGLITRFLIETGALVLVAFVIGILALYILLPYVNLLSGKNFSISDLVAWKILFGIAALFMVTSFLSGTYPAFYITRFNPVVVLKGLTGSPGSEGYFLRKVLMTTQFTISIVLVVLSIVFWQQMEFISNKPLGFQTSNIITIPLFSDTPNSIFGGGVDGPMRARMNAFENELVKNAAVEGVTASAILPGTGFMVRALVWTDKIKESDNVLLAAMAVDYDFIQTYKMEVIAGRPFSKEAGTDHLQAFMINEQAVEQLGFEDPADAIGQHLGCLGKNGTIIGVVRDFHFQGLQAAVTPMVLEVAAGKFQVFSVSLSGGTDLKSMIEVVKGEWDKAFPEKVFEFHFLDQALENNYNNERRMVNMMQCFSVLAILISALGLFGLAAYVNHQRSKEVSIRKILGANVRQVFYILSGEFLKMSLLAFLIAVPLAYYFADQWLNSFAYRVGLGAMAFIIGGVVAIATVLITISYETMRSAKVNPVESLRE